LCGMCPHELFTNTKADIGNCDKIHDDELKKDFAKASLYQRTQVEDDFERMVQSHLREVDKKIARGHNRLKLSKEQTLDVGESSMLFGGPNDDKIKMLTERINDLVDQAEALGCEGKVEEAQGITRLLDRLKDERQQLAYQGSRLPSMIDTAMREEKMMEVCDICGAFLIVGDAQSRIDDHLMGKQHMGYAKLRNCLAQLRESREKAKEEREKAKAEAEAERLKRREDRDGKSRDKSRDRDDRRGSSRRDDRRRSRSRDRGRRSRSRDRAGKGRDRSRSRDRVGRDRDRGKRSRSRDSRDSRKREDAKSRDGDKNKARSSRSRSRDRKRRSRSRSRDKKKGDRKDRSRSRDRQRDDRKEVKKDRDDKDEKHKEEKRDNDKSEDDSKDDAAGAASSTSLKSEDGTSGGEDKEGTKMGVSSLLSRIRNGDGYPT